MALGDTPENPLPATTTKVEWKVKVATIATYLTGLVGLAVINGATSDNNKLLIDALPDWLEPFVLPLVPAIVTFVAAYSARHQYRALAVGRR